ncbi:MAG: hypothetical protein JXQ29_14900 [Planctomycetes bacterium]|nr:hypothetical protein [Planctomycetota bacterium]
MAWGRSLVPILGDALVPAPTEIAVGELVAANTGFHFFSLRPLGDLR